MTKFLDLTTITSRRLLLAEAITTLDVALSVPVGDLPKWRNKVTSALEITAKKIAIKIAELESPDGLFGYMESDFPHLSRRVAQHKVDHERLQLSISALCQTLGELGDEDLRENVFIIRTQAVEFMGHVSLLTQRDSDLVYDAYGIDISEPESRQRPKEVANF